MENQKTAVEWMINELHKKQNGDGSELSYNKIFAKAKQMEREQIEKAWWAGHDERDSQKMIHPSEDCNGYYTQTYGETK